MNGKKNPPLVRARFIIPALVKLNRAGRDVAALAQKHGLPAKDIWTPDALLPAPQCNAMLTEATDLLGDRFLSAKIGSEWAKSAGAPFDEAKRRATNLGHLLTLVAVELSTEVTTGRCELKANANYAIFTGQREYQPGKTAEFGAAAFVSFIVHLIKQSVGEKWDHQMMAVVTPFHDSLPTSLLPKGSILAGPNDLFQFRFPVEWLDEQSGFSPNKITDEPHRSQRIEASLVSSVQDYLRGKMPDGDTSIDEAAQAFSYPVREFQRRLRASSASYRSLLNVAKMDYAGNELKTPGTSIRELAEKLGYNKVGNFSRAFKTHFGRTPSDWQSK